MSEPASQAPDRMWSVTELIAAGLPKPPLIPWASRVTAERAYDQINILTAFANAGDRDAAVKWMMEARWEKTGIAAARGTDVHTQAERIALGADPDTVDPNILPYVAQYQRFLTDHHPQFEAAEAAVYNLTYRYAGTLDAIVTFDAIATVDGAKCVLDIKTTDKSPDARTRPPYPDVALQAVAYTRCEKLLIGTPVRAEVGRKRYYTYDPTAHYEPMPATVGALALVISPVDYQLIPLRVDDTVWEAFLAVREVARWALSTSKTVLGPAIHAKARAA